MDKKMSFLYKVFITTFLTLFMCLFVNVSDAYADMVTDASDPTRHYVWNEIGNMTFKTGNTYVICCNWYDISPKTARVNGKLTIEEGAVIEFGNSYFQNKRVIYSWGTEDDKHYLFSSPYLMVDSGSIVAEGTADKHITFKLTESDKEYIKAWNYIDLCQNGSNNVFKYCDFIDGGTGDTNHYGMFTLPKIDEYSDDTKDLANNTSNNITFENCTFDSGYTKDDGTCISNNVLHINNYNYNGNVTFKGCTFNNECMRAVMVDGDTDMNLTVDGCKFTEGSFRATSFVIYKGTGNLVIKDNTFNDLKGYIPIQANTNCPKTLDFEGNTFNGSSNTINYPIVGRIESNINAEDRNYTTNVFSNEYPEKYKYLVIEGNINEGETKKLNKLKGMGYSLISGAIKGKLELLEGVEINLEKLNTNSWKFGSFKACGTKDNPVIIKAIGCTNCLSVGSEGLNLSNCTINNIGFSIDRTAETDVNIDNTSWVWTQGNSNPQIIIKNYIQDKSVNISNSTFDAKSALNLVDVNNVNISNCIFTGEGADQYGQGINITGTDTTDEIRNIKISNCLFTNLYYGLCLDYFSNIVPSVNNVTISKCKTGIYAGNINLSNSIISSNSNYDLEIKGNTCCGDNISIYNCCFSKYYKTTNDNPKIFMNNLIGFDPLFADADNSDFHLQSPYGRWNGTEWITTDTKLSPCINAGCTTSVYTNEPAPNGGVVNMGYYGNTDEASKFNDKYTYISSAAINGITIPIYNIYNNTNATVPNGAFYKISNVEWTPEVNSTFAINTVYTVKITLEAYVRQRFGDDFSATINGDNAKILSNTGDMVTISYSFKSTGVTVTPSTSKITNGSSTTVNATVSTNNTSTDNQKVSWVSEDTSIAVVDADGKVTGKGVGITIITANATAYDENGKTGTMTITVLPGKTSSIKAAVASYNSIKLNWSKVAGAKGYYIYRSTSKNGTYSIVKTITSDSTLTFTNTGLYSGTTYYYKVRAYGMSGTTKLNSNLYSSIVYAKPVLATPKPKAASYSYNSNKISWSKVTGASGYIVYRATSKTGTYTAIKTITNGTLYYIDTNRLCGTTYYYKVVAYRKNTSTNTYRATSTIVYAKPVLATTTVTLTKVSSSKIKVSYKKVAGASGYVIYRATAKNGTYSAVKTVTSGSTLSFTNTGLKKGKTYYYKVRAYRTVNGKRIYGGYSVIKYKYL